jgi:glycerate dehydrogenase
MVNSRNLSLMKSGALLVNAARGGLVVEEDLAQALRDGKIAGVALEVVSRELIGADNPLLSALRCPITPHIAWATREARRRLMSATAQNIQAFLDGAPINVVS